MGQTILTELQKKALIAISKDTIIKNNFYLTGGTALSEYYLHHRLSEDLDFFSGIEIDTIWLTAFTKKIKSEINASKSDIQQSFNRNLVFFTIGKTILKTEFTYFPFTQIEKGVTIHGLQVDSLIDIAVNKFFTVYQKPASRHFIDLYIILQKSTLKWENLAKLARIKFDTNIDPLQLGSQLITAKKIGLLPKTIIFLEENAWRNYFLEKAKELKKQIAK